MQNSRDIQRIQPNMRETLELWRLPAAADTTEDRQLKAEITQNIMKTTKTIYHTIYPATSQNSAKCIMDTDIPDDSIYNNIHVLNKNTTDGKPKDLSWFAGCHTDSTTILYIPPKQGWKKNDG